MDRIVYGYLIENNDNISKLIQDKKLQIKKLTSELKLLEESINKPNKKVNDYIINLLSKYDDQLIKTQKTEFSNYWIHHTIITPDTLQRINISCDYKKPFFGKLKELHNITLLIDIDGSNYHFFKI